MGDTRKEEAELSLRKKYHKTIFSRFARAINTYRLVEDGDHVAVCIAQGGNGLIAFASSFPGSIKAFEIGPGQEYIFQKKAFLAGEPGVNISVHFHKKVASGLFGGEGFILQKESGNGIVFAEFDGHVVEYELQPGQQIVIDSGYLAAMSVTCQMDIQTVPGLKNIVFGGEGLFNTVITGPGHVWLQTMPISSVADSLRPYFPTSSK